MVEICFSYHRLLFSRASTRRLDLGNQNVFFRHSFHIFDIPMETLKSISTNRYIESLNWHNKKADFNSLYQNGIVTNKLFTKLKPTKNKNENLSFRFGCFVFEDKKKQKKIINKYLVSLIGLVIECKVVVDCDSMLTRFRGRSLKCITYGLSKWIQYSQLVCFCLNFVFLILNLFRRLKRPFSTLLMT